jgi:DNA-binding NtrC family response regulator
MFKETSDRTIETRDDLAQLLLIGEPDNAWQHSLEIASQSLGRLRTLAISELIQESMNYDCYILDAASIPDVIALIKQIRRQHNEARIMVASDDTSWKKARAAFRAGAIDYIRCEDDYKHLHAMLEENLKKRFGTGCG